MDSWIASANSSEVSVRRFSQRTKVERSIAPASHRGCAIALTCLACVLAACLSASPTLAIQGMGVTNNTDNAIGQTFDLYGRNCSGTIIDNRVGTNHNPPAIVGDDGLVLTAAHCVDATSGAAAPVAHFNYFRSPPVQGANGPRIASLGVRYPGVDGTTGRDDVGVLLVTKIVGKGVIFDSYPIATANPNLVDGMSTVNAVGYGPVPPATSLLDTARQATFTLSAKDATHYEYRTTFHAGANNINTAWFNVGDSGGPSLRNVAGISTVVGLHSYRSNTGMNVSNSVDMRVEPYFGFLQGDGVGGKAAFDRFIPTFNLCDTAATSKWSNQSCWQRTSTLQSEIPGANDVVILRALSSPSTFALDANTTNLEGLLVAEQMTFDSKTGFMAEVGGLSGMVNGGTVNLAGGAVTKVSNNLHNVGTFNVGQKGTLRVDRDTLNDSGGTMVLAGAVNNQALANLSAVQNMGTLTIKDQSQLTVTAVNPLTPTANIALANTGTLTIEAGGVLEVNKHYVTNRGGNVQVAGGRVKVVRTAGNPPVQILNEYDAETMTGAKFRLQGVNNLDGGPEGVGAIVTLDGGEFINDSQSALFGDGTLEFLGESGFQSLATPLTSPLYDTRFIDFAFLNAIATLERTSAVPGNGPYGLSDPFAARTLRVLRASQVRLVDLASNQSSGDTLFLAGLVVSGDSLLDVFGGDLWVNGDVSSQLDGLIFSGRIVDSGLLPGSYLDATFEPLFGATHLRSVPEPAMGIVGLLGVLAAMGRRGLPRWR